MRRMLFGMAVVCLTACTTGNVAYHANMPPAVPDSVEDIISGDPRNRLAFIESDDMGELFSDGQLRNALALIGSVRDDEDGAIIVTYVHGWNHNAAPGNDNLEQFRETILRKIVEQEKSDAKRLTKDPANPVLPRRVIGIYVGWRGNLYRLKVPGIFVFSYYNRNSAATRVGGSTASEVLAAITHAVHLNERSRSVVIGHSLGGLITEASLIPPLQEALERKAVADREQMSVTLSPKDVAEFPSDVIVLVNPASRALQAKKFLSMLERWDVTVKGKSPYELPLGQPEREREGKRPLVVSVTSEDDWATGFVFQTANTLVSANKNFRPYPSAPGSTPTFGKQFRLFTHNAGHMPPLFSHLVDYQENASGSDPDDLVRPCVAGATTAANGTCVAVGPDRFVLETNPESYNRRPYWIMQVSRNVIPDHSNVFTPGFYRLVKAVLAITGGFGRELAKPPETPEPPAPKHSEATVWGERLETATVSARMPQPCDAPPPIALAWQGSESTCTSRNPATPCFVGESVTLYVMDREGRQYQPQPCDTIEWQLPGRVPVSEKLTSVSTEVMGSGSMSASVTVFNHIAKQTASTSNWISVNPEIPITIRYSGSKCSSDNNEVCVAGEPITFSAQSPEQAGKGSFWWEIGSHGRLDGQVVSFTFPNEETAEVRAHFVADAGRGSEKAKVNVGPVPCKPPSGVSIAVEGRQDRCEMGDGCFAATGIVLKTQYHNESNRCYVFAWTVDGRPAGNGDSITPVLTAGSHEIGVTVTSSGVSESVRPSRTITICPEPARVVLDFEGKDSKCTRESVCAGGSCWIGETIRFKTRGRDLAGCERVEWQLIDGERATDFAPSRIYSKTTESLIAVRVETEGGATEDRTLLRVGPPAPGPIAQPTPVSQSCPPMASIGITYKSGTSGCKPGGTRCKTGEWITFSLTPDDAILRQCPGDSFLWLFDDGPPQIDRVAEHQFKTRGVHGVHVVAVRDGRVATASTTVDIPRLKCQPCPSTGKGAP